MKTVRFIIPLVVAVFCLTALAQAESPAEFYKGKNIDFVLNDRPGGDAEMLARLMGPFIKEYAGATAIYSNKRGAGGSDGYVDVYKAKPDGLTMGVATLLPMILNKVTDNPGAKYDPEKYGWIGSFLRVRNVFVVAPDGPYKTVADLKAAKKLVLGATSPQGNLALATMTCIELLGLDAKVITGTKGAGAMAQIVMSGEVAGTCLPMQLALAGIKDGHYRALFTLATERFDQMPDVPSILEVANIKGDAQKENLLNIWDEGLILAQAIMVSPGVSKEKIEFLRGLMPLLVKSPQFRQDINKLWAFNVPDRDILTGEQVEKLVDKTMHNAASMKSIFNELLKKYKL